MKILFILLLLSINVDSSKVVPESEKIFGVFEDAQGDIQPKRSFLGGIVEAKPMESYTLKGEGIEDGKFSWKTTDLESKPWVCLFQLLSLDREEKDNYTMHLLKFNSSSSVGDTSLVKVIVKVSDVNDNQPVFDANSLFADVREDYHSGKSFHRVTASDVDLVGNTFRFSKINGSEEPSEGNCFDILPNGEITVVCDTLDAEKTSEITFRVRVQDSNGSGDCFSNEATMVINIEDANDHAPQIVISPSTVDVGELTSIGTNIFKIEATDGDHGVFSEIAFNITNGNDEGRFVIKSFPSHARSYALLYVNDWLDHETQPEYTLTILAYNPASDDINTNNPILQDDILITIRITDENEAPVFVGTPYSYLLVDGLKFHKLLTPSVLAVDKDFGGRQVLTYSLENGKNWFTIDSKNGQITMIRSLDREHGDHVDHNTGIYTLIVKATDEEGESAFTEYSVTIEDVNDHSPQPDGRGWNARICLPQQQQGEEEIDVTVISASDMDGPKFGSPFTFTLASLKSNLTLHRVGDNSVRVSTKKSDFANNIYKEVVYIEDTNDEGKMIRTGTGTLTITICSCEEDGRFDCENSNRRRQQIAEISSAPHSYFTSLNLIIAAVAVLMTVIICVAATFCHHRSLLRNKSDEKDEDDIRETLNTSDVEGGGEVDNIHYNFSCILSEAEPSYGDDHKLIVVYEDYYPAVRNVGKLLDDFHKRTAAQYPPFDSLLIYKYEGTGSIAASSLTSINTATTDESQHFDFLCDGDHPMPLHIALMYQGTDSD